MGARTRAWHCFTSTSKRCRMPTAKVAVLPVPIHGIGGRRKEREGEEIGGDGGEEIKGGGKKRG